MIYFYKPQKFILLFYSLVNCFLTFAEEWWPQPSTRNHEDRHQERQLRWKVICSHTLAHWLIDSKVTGRWWLPRNLSPLETATAPTRPWRTFFFLPLPPCFHYTLPPTSNARCFASASLCVSAAQQMVRVFFFMTPPPPLQTLPHSVRKHPYRPTPKRIVWGVGVSTKPTKGWRWDRFLWPIETLTMDRE